MPARAGAMMLIAALTACGSGVDSRTYALTGGSAARGRAAIGAYGCGACHVIPGVRGATGRVGPSLADIANQAYIGGVVSNNPRHLIAWIENPPALSPRTAMPDLNVRPADARDIAAYLYTLR